MLPLASTELAEHLDSRWAGANHRSRDSDKEAMLDDAGNGGEPVRQFVWARNGTKKAIQDQMPVVADERFSAGRFAQADFTLAAAAFCRRQNHAFCHFEAENIDFDGQGMIPEYLYGF